MPGWYDTSRHERGYGYQWTKLRKIVMQRDVYLCQPCLSKGRPTPAKQVDHIVPKSRDGLDDLDNLQAICVECHKAKTKAEATGRQKVTFSDDGWPM